MSNRHLSRTIAMQTLYEWDFNHRSQKLQELIQRNIKENFGQEDDQGFVERLVKGVTKNLAEIDKVIEKYAPEWPIDKITIVDRNVLRLGIYEMLFVKINNKEEKEVPAKVIINEAIEMAKAFGGSSSGKFINGVLGAVLIDLENKNVKFNYNASDEKILKQEIKEYSVGAVVFKKDNQEIKFALIKDANNKWTFAKEKIADFVEKEKTRQALSREIEEELGIKNINILKQIGEIDVVVHSPEKGNYHKKIFYYLAETKDEKLISENTTTVKDAKWFNKKEVLENLGYENTKEIFEKAIQNL